MYTLVRHNLWTIGAFPQFRRGLEPLRVGRNAACLVHYRGGVLLYSLPEAWDAAEGFMYPSGNSTIPADPRGGFMDVPVLRHQLFVPEFSGDLIAA